MAKKKYIDTKKFYESKTLWFNALMTVLLLAELLRELPWVSPEMLTVLIGAGNVVLRVWFTKKAVE